MSVGKSLNIYLLEDPVWFSDKLDVGCEKKDSKITLKYLHEHLKKYSRYEWRWGTLKESVLWRLPGVQFTCQIDI